MFARAQALTVGEKQKNQLEALIRSGSTPQRTARRCQVVLMASQGLSNHLIAQQTGLSRPTVLAARAAFAKRGTAGICEPQKRKRSRRVLTPELEQRILDTTLKTRPADATHWSARGLAAKLGVSRMMVQRLWQRYDIQPHRVEKFKISNDPKFEDKVRDVVGLYLDPPDRALVLCVDEKSQIQALDRTAPILPLRPGLPERQTHDYKRHGTTTLFAAFDVLEGKVIGRCMQKHRHQEFIRFLNQIEAQVPAKKAVHVVLDNYATHKHPKVRKWLDRHPRFTFHFTPTSSSWLNAVEGFFAKLSRRRLKRGVFRSVRELKATINRFLDETNSDPKPFTWTADRDKIVAAVKRGHQMLDSIH